MLSTTHVGLATVIEVGSDIDIASAHVLESAIALAEPSWDERVIVSLEHCNYCDSSGLAVLYRARKRLGEQLRIVVPSDVRIRRIFDICGMNQQLAICDSLREALQTPIVRTS